MNIYISDSEEPFILHRDLVTETSQLLQQYRSESAITLPDESPALFEVYAEWIYSNRSLTILHNLRAHETVKRGDGSGLVDQPGAEHLFHLYCLGERLRDAAFKNAVVDAYADMLNEGGSCPTHFARWIYAELPPGNAFARLYVDMWCWNSDGSWFEELEAKDDPNTAPAAFWLDVVKRKTQLGKKVFDARLRAPWVADRTQYYEVEEQPLQNGGEKRGQVGVQRSDGAIFLVKQEPEGP